MTTPSAPVVDDLLVAADHWDHIADRQEEAARTWARQLGDTSAYLHRARTYRMTAEVLRREARTGKPHCSACGGAHANNEHSSLPEGAHDGRCRCGDACCFWCMNR